MKRLTLLVGAAALTFASTKVATQQPAPTTQPAPAPRPYFVGNALGLPVEPGADGKFEGCLVEREDVRRHLLRRELLVR